MRNSRKLLLMLLLTPLLSGCPLLSWLGFPVGNKVPYDPKAESGDIAARKNIQFDDVPVPIGFELDRRSVFSFQGYSFRFGRFLYEGVWSLRNTAAFYREQMPVAGWEHLQTTKGDYIETQVYKKGLERCRVTIKSAENVEVLVQVYDANSENNLMASK